MCGLIVLAGPRAEHLVHASLEQIKHRGPDEQNIHIERMFALGFQRLAINGGPEEGCQPFEMEGWLSVINGEIYNYRELEQRYQLGSHGCDASVVLPLYLRLEEHLIDVLDGFYSGVMVSPDRSFAICLRDSLGKKPLFAGMHSGVVFITSELKALDSVNWFKPLPKGVSNVDLITGEIKEVRQHPANVVSYKSIKQALIESVRKRLPRPEQPVAIFLSGGLDSSLIASIASRFRDDIAYFTLGGNTTDDTRAALLVSQYLNLKNVFEVPLPKICELPELISQIVYATESYNPSIISNGLATLLLARAVKKASIKVVLTGEGADELFCGYHNFLADEPWKETRKQLIGDMTFTELRRLDMACMFNSIEPRCPFLDKNIQALSDEMPYEELYCDEMNKAVLRRKFKGLLPPAVLNRQKVSCDVGSGIRSMVVKYLRRNGRSERGELLDVWKQHFQFDPSDSYFHSYPVFDSVIDARGKGHR